MTLRALLVGLVLLGCRQRLPEPVLPLTPTPDAEFRAKPPELGPPRPARAPEVSSTTLANGMTVLVSEQPGLARVSLVYANRAAHEVDDPRLFGLANLTAHALDEGTKLSDGRELARLRFGGARPVIEASLSGTTIAVDAVGSALEPGILLLADFVRSPLLGQAGIVAAREKLAEHAFQRSLLVRTHLRRAAFDSLTGANDPTVRGEARGFSKSAVQKFHRERYRAVDSALIVVGPVHAAEVFSFAERAFGDWSAADAGEPARAEAKRRWKSSNVIHALVGDDRQAAFAVALPCAGAADAESVHFDVLAMILANLFGSRAMKALRHEQGISYGIHADCEQRRDRGVFWIEFSADTNAARNAIDKVLEEVRRLRLEPVTQQELELARGRLLGTTQARMGGSRALAATYLLGLPLDYFATFRARLAAVDARALRATAGRYFDESQMGIAVYGDKSALEQSLAGLGTLDWSYLERPSR